MPQIRWLPAAAADIERLHAFVYEKSPDAAARAVAGILRAADLLIDTPLIGLQMPDDSGRRELFMKFGAGAYVLRYKLEDPETVIIIRVWHSREDRGP